MMARFGKTYVAGVGMALMLAGCVGGASSPDIYANRGDPESMLDISSEVVTIGLKNPKAHTELLDWLKREQPRSADLACDAATASCRKAREALEQYGVKFRSTGAGANEVSLIYERVIARDCDPRYLDNHSNPYNVNYSAFGCAVKANMVRSVAPKRQMLNPATLGSVDGEKAVMNYQGYMNPPADTTDDSLLESQSD